MKNIFKFTSVAALAAALMLGGSCTSNFEEINTDPDALATGSPTNMLGYVLRSTMFQHGSLGDATSTWAGYIVKIQYMDNFNYLPTNNTYGNKFSCCYRMNEQLDDVLALTEESADQLKNIRWVARIWKEFLWLWTTDQFGDIPYSEANQVAEGNAQPVYDDQSTIYPAILTNLKTIADEMAAGLSDDAIGEGDFLFNGDIALWQKFCNSLRMRAAMRIVNVAPDLAQSTIEEICQNPSAYPLLETSDENADFYWQGSDPYFEPWYDDSRTRNDWGMSNIFVAHMTSMNDPRISAMMKPATTDGQYRGYENGALSNPTELNSISTIGAIYRDTPDGFTPVLRSCENYFIKAEAAMRGWNVGTTAQAAYEEAVRISMEDNGVSDADAEAYLAGSGRWDNTLERIYMEEWVALFKNGVEAWSLYRRTGYPQEIVTSGEYPGAYCSFGTTHNDVPFRMPYPDNEYQYNEDNVRAAAANIVDNTWGEQMWWDTRTGVH